MKFYRFLLILLFLFIPISSFAVNSNQYLIVFSIDGLRYDYFHTDSLPNIQKLQDNGVKAFSLQPVFPTTYYPNYYSIITGLYPENHGIISNYFTNPYNLKSFNNRINDSENSSEWFNGETLWQTARKYNLKSAIFDINSYDTNDFHNPNYSINTKDFNIFKSINQISKILLIKENKRPHIIFFRYDHLDNISHKYGLESDELKNEMHNIDSAIGLLYSFINNSKLQDSVNIILLSSHGISDFNSKNLSDISNLLRDYHYSYQNYGAYMMIDADIEEQVSIYLKLKSNQEHFKVYTKNNIPKYLHFSNNPLISPILLIADKGWMLLDSSTNGSLQYLKASHGYSNKILDMHGIFIGNGNAFKKGLETQTLLNIDLYPLFCAIFGIVPRNKIDGKLNRIEFILKGN